MKRTFMPSWIIVLFGLGACVLESEVGMKPDDDEEGKTDQWNYANDPSRFRVEFDYRLSQLPREGEAEQIPWADDYWSYYNDSINHRWRGASNPSPAELYDLAFNSWQMPEGYMALRPRADRAATWDADYYNRLGPLATEVHSRRGNERMTNGRDDDGDGEVDECDSEDCDGVEFWWGVCHAWAPAAVMEPEPVNPVEHNGRTFYPSDIKALMMIAYDSTSAIMLGGRCNARDVERDENGRATLAECQDVNAGAFHVVITNMLGVHRRAFDEDRTYDYQVWNQPIRSFRVTSLREGLTATEANQVLGITGDSYSFNGDAVSFAEVRMDVRYITESHPSEQPTLPIIDRYTRTDRYHYVLELDAEGNVIGGEWATTSQSNHPDFLWLPTRNGTYFRNITYANVRMLLDMSRRPTDPGGGGEGEGQVFEVRPGTAIPDNSQTGARATIEVPDSGTIQGLQVAVDIQHTYIGDLTVLLERDGRQVQLQRHQGGSADDLVTTFNVTDFDGSDVRGAWTLFVTDDAAQDLGTIRRFALVAVLGSGGGGGGTTGPRTYESTTAVPIPDNSSRGATSAIQVSDSGTIRDLRVRVNIEHTYIGDLVVELRHDGQVRTLHNRTGRGEDNIQAEYQVTELNGAPVSGTWELFVRDAARVDTGRIVGWSMIATLE